LFPFSLLKDAAFIAKTVEGKLPSLFGKLPRQPFTVVPVPEYLAPNYTSGRYSGAPISSTRAGEYWVNTSNLPNRTLYTLESLTLHEAVPGHHLQISLTQELTDLPEFRRAEYQFKSYLNPIQTDAGFHATLASRGNRTITSKKDAEQYIILLKDIPRFVDENLQLMRQGIALGITQPREVLNGYETSYTQHIVGTAEQSVFWKPFDKKPAAISEADWAALQTTAKAVIVKDVIGSYQQIKTFFDQEYLPKARPTLGASGFPNGRAYYEDRVRHFTTTTLTSEEVYQLGLKEVARIRSEMDNVIRDVKFKGSFKQFVSFFIIKGCGLYREDRGGQIAFAIW
jgi:uncharacterized protein (DUF885 family)